MLVGSADYEEVIDHWHCTNVIRICFRMPGNGGIIMALKCNMWNVLAYCYVHVHVLASAYAPIYSQVHACCHPRMYVYVHVCMLML